MIADRIAKSEGRIQWLDRKLNGLDVLSSVRNRLAGACFDIAMEHQRAIVVLAHKELYGSAFSLLRPVAEAYVRGVWLHKCASEDQLDKFAQDKVPDFVSLVAAVEKLESHKEGVLSKMRLTSWRLMNDYTHTGYVQICSRLTADSIKANYHADEVLQALDYSDAFGYISAIAICDLANEVDVANQILQRVKAEWPVASQHS